MTDTLQPVRLPAQFHYRVDPYWQAIALYAVTLILYAVLRAVWDSTLQQDGLVSVVLTDPVVILLGLFVVWSATSLIFNSIAARTIIVSDDAITFTSRFHERSFDRSEIERITVGRDQRIKVRGVFSVIKIRIKDRRRPLRIRPALYTDENGLVAAILQFRSTGHGKA
jgi:cell division protein FtsL